MISTYYRALYAVYVIISEIADPGALRAGRSGGCRHLTRRAGLASCTRRVHEGSLKQCTLDGRLKHYKSHVLGYKRVKEIGM